MPILSRINPVDTRPSYFCKIYVIYLCMCVCVYIYIYIYIYIIGATNTRGEASATAVLWKPFSHQRLQNFAVFSLSLCQALLVNSYTTSDV